MRTLNPNLSAIRPTEVRHVTTVSQNDLDDLLPIFKEGYGNSFLPTYFNRYKDISRGLIVRDIAGIAMGAALVHERRIVMSAPIRGQLTPAERMEIKVELIDACRRILGATWATVGENQTRVLEAYSSTGMQPVFDFRIAKRLLSETIAPSREIEQTPLGLVLLSDYQSGHPEYRQKILAYPEDNTFQ